MDLSLEEHIIMCMLSRFDFGAACVWVRVCVCVGLCVCEVTGFALADDPNEAEGLYLDTCFFRCCCKQATMRKGTVGWRKQRECKAFFFL